MKIWQLTVPYEGFVIIMSEFMIEDGTVVTKIVNLMLEMKIREWNEKMEAHILGGRVT